MSVSQNRLSKREKGDAGEDAAVEYLIKKGFVIVGRNVRVGKTEIDIIAREKDVLVFVEVKARHSYRFGLPTEGVTDAKAWRIQRAMEAYMARGQMDCPCRCDVISIINNGGELNIRHIPNAFF